MITRAILPATAEEIVEQTGRAPESVYGELVSLEAMGLVKVRCLWTHAAKVANEWHCDPDALCLASRDGFCDAPEAA